MTYALNLIDDINIFLKIKEATKPFCSYIYDEINNQIKLSKRKKKKAIWLIDRLELINQHVDLNMINCAANSSEIKVVAKACAFLCAQLKKENDELQSHYVEEIEFDLLGDFLKNVDEINDKSTLEKYENRLYIPIPKLNFNSTFTKHELEKRLLDPIFFARKIRKQLMQNRHQIFNFLRAVGKNRSKYACINSIEEYRQSLDATEHFLTTRVLINKRTGEKLNLKEMAITPYKRFCQFHRISVGLEDKAIEKGMTSAMITLTAPPEYHVNPSNYNENWSKSGYADHKKTNKWIAEKWKLVNDRLQKNCIDYHGMHVGESHTDSTPHWHAVIYFYEKDKNEIKRAIAEIWSMIKITYNIDLKKYNKKGKGYKRIKKIKDDNDNIKTFIDLKKYGKPNKTTKNKIYYEKITAEMVTKKIKKNGKYGISKEDKRRIGKIEHVLRFDSIKANWIDTDKTKSERMSSYIAKYIAKTCMYDVERSTQFQDLEKQKIFEQEKTNYLAVQANRSIWSVRAFGFFGMTRGAIGLYKEYRKQSIYVVKNELEKSRINAACTGNFCEFLNLIENNKPRLAKTESINKYGETTLKVIGYIANHTLYKTKHNDFKIVKLEDADKEINLILNQNKRQVKISSDDNLTKLNLNKNNIAVINNDPSDEEKMEEVLDEDYSNSVINCKDVFSEMNEVQKSIMLALSNKREYDRNTIELNKFVTWLDDLDNLKTEWV